ncbi:MAG: nucleotidyltransferase family protein [Alphaproteobacteria bacterium]
MGSLFTVVLGAGLSKRFGSPKLDAQCAGRAVGSWVLHAVSAAGLPPGGVVVGPNVPLFLHEWPSWFRLQNRAPEAGLASSLAIAAQYAEAQGSETMLVMLADMPLLDPRFLRKLVAASAPTATVQCDGRPGVPALLPRAMYPALFNLAGDRGAGKLLAQQPELVCVEAPAGMLMDIDQPEDLARAELTLSSRSSN